MVGVFILWKLAIAINQGFVDCFPRAGLPASHSQSGDLWILQECPMEALQKREALETELQNAHGELKSTLRQLQELRDVLQKAQLSLEEKYTTIKDLTAELR